MHFHAKHTRCLLSQQCNPLPERSHTHTHTRGVFKQAWDLVNGESIYLNAIQQLAHAPEAVGLDVPQHLLLQAGNIEIFHLVLCREKKTKQRVKRKKEVERTERNGRGRRRKNEKKADKVRRDNIAKRYH